MHTWRIDTWRYGPFILILDIKWKWVVRFMQWRLYPCYALNWWLSGIQKRFVWLEKEKNVALAGIWTTVPRTFGPQPSQLMFHERKHYWASLVLAFRESKQYTKTTFTQLGSAALPFLWEESGNSRVKRSVSIWQLDIRSVTLTIKVQCKQYTKTFFTQLGSATLPYLWEESGKSRVKRSISIWQLDVRSVILTITG